MFHSCSQLRELWFSDLFMYIVIACIMVRSNDIRTERVNEEILLGKKRISMQVYQLHVCT